MRGAGGFALLGAADVQSGGGAGETVFGGDFWPNLLVTAVPFGVFLGVAAVIRFGPWGRPPQKEEDGR